MKKILKILGIFVGVCFSIFFGLYLLWLVIGISIETYGSYPNHNIGKVAYFYREDRGMFGAVEGETKVIILDWYIPFIPRLFNYEKKVVFFSEGYYSGYVKWEDDRKIMIHLNPFNNSSSDDEYFGKEYNGIKIDYQFDNIQ